VIDATNTRRKTMPELGPDRRAGYKNIDVIEGYNKWSSIYDQSPNPLIALEEKMTLEFIEDVQGQRALDLGCGTGRYCVLLTKRGAKVIGVDPSSGMLEQAKEKVTPMCHFELCHGTVEKMGFPSEYFDLVISALTLSHLPELEPTLGEAVRVLKTGGRMIVSDIHPYWPISGHDYAEFFDEAGQEYRIPEYPHLFGEYWSLFSKLGMRVKDIREPQIDDGLIERFPSLKDYQGIPLAMILKIQKSSCRHSG
jgi:ubiquinone/menaquinone biosynthesis C-methylase UbiE